MSKPTHDATMIRITNVAWLFSALLIPVCLFRESFAEWAIVFEAVFIFSSQIGFAAGSVGLFYFRCTSLSRTMRTCAVLNGILVVLYCLYDLISFLFARDMNL